MRNLIALLCCAFLAGAVVAAAVDYDAAAIRFAPHFWFQTREDHFPATLEHLLASACLVIKDGDWKLVKQPVTLGDLWWRNDSYAIQLFDAADVHSLSDPSVNALYYNVQTGPSFVRINYWLIYSYNGPRPVTCLIGSNAGRHAGDIERVSIYLDLAATTLKAVDYSQHAGHQCMTSGWSSDDTHMHPHVVVGRDSHANYPTDHASLECLGWNNYWAPKPIRLPDPMMAYAGDWGTWSQSDSSNSGCSGFWYRRGTLTTPTITTDLCTI